MKKLVILGITALFVSAFALSCRQPERTETISDTKEVIEKQENVVTPAEERPAPQPGE